MKWGKLALVIFGAIVITALGIDAADTLQGNTGTLLSRVIPDQENDGRCPDGMVAVDNVPTLTCVDMFEASASDECPTKQPAQILHTRQNIEEKNCQAASEQAVDPWRFVTRDQAIQMCSRAGKRLPTSAEWYALSAGLASVESACNLSSGSLSKTGSQGECVSGAGAYDLVGNVWEWVSDDVIDGMYNARKLPESGYVTQVDAHGVATVASSTPNDLFESDYFWSDQEGAFAMIRGGYFDSGTDGGLYTVHADTVPTSAGVGIGFRCVF